MRSGLPVRLLFAYCSPTVRLLFAYCSPSYRLSYWSFSMGWQPRIMAKTYNLSFLITNTCKTHNPFFYPPLNLVTSRFKSAFRLFSTCIFHSGSKSILFPHFISQRMSLTSSLCSFKILICLSRVWMYSLRQQVNGVVFSSSFFLHYFSFFLLPKTDFILYFHTFLKEKSDSLQKSITFASLR